MFSDRRVHRLKLRGPGHEAIRHAAIVVEDALRTASVPGLPQNGLLLMRRLHLGKLPIYPTSVAVARRIESRLLTAGLTVVRKDAEDQPQARVIWFRDEVEPYALLAGLLGRNIHPESWYWPRAVKGWSSQMAIGQGLRHILYQVSGTEAGMAGATRVVEQLITDGGIEALGKSLQPQDGHLFLALAGIQFPRDATAKGYTVSTPLLFPHLPRSWRQTFVRLGPQWGPNDARTVWLAHTAVCARYGLTSPQVVNGLLQQLHKLQREMPAPAPQKSPRAPTSSPERGIAEKLQERPHETGGRPQHPRAPGEPTELEINAKTTQPAKNTAGQVPGSAERTDRASAASTPADKPSRRAMLPNQTGIFQEQNRARENPSIEAPCTTVTPEDGPIDHKEDRTIPTDTQRGDTKPLLNESGAAKSESADNRHDRQPRRRPELSYASWEIALEGAESGYAGFAFLVQVLEWLDIRATLAAHPLLEALNLPTRILRHCVDHLEIPHDDPICNFLAELPPVPPEAVIDFAAPAVWKMYCWPPTSDKTVLTMRRVQGIPQRRMLCDNNGKLTVAVWCSPMPPAVRKWIQGHTILHLPAVPPARDLDRIISTYAAAIDAFLDRYAQTDLRRMVKRPGYVAATPTHLDITFDQNQLDIGIRKAGLDIDPGWVPWLGRVIYFHYKGHKEIIDV